MMTDTIPQTNDANRSCAGAPGSAVLAWDVEIHDLHCIVFAETKAKAQWVATKSYWEAYGRRKGEWPRARAVRAPRHDNSRLGLEPPKAYSEDYVY